jgi:hypothetical protein
VQLFLSAENDDSHQPRVGASTTFRKPASAT